MAKKSELERVMEILQGQGMEYAGVPDTELNDKVLDDIYALSCTARDGKDAAWFADANNKALIAYYDRFVDKEEEAANEAQDGGGAGEDPTPPPTKDKPTKPKKGADKMKTAAAVKNTNSNKGAADSKSDSKKVVNLKAAREAAEAAKKAAAATKAAKVAKQKEKGAPVKRGEAGRFGHALGSMANALDDMLVKGVTKDAAVAALVKDFGRDEAQAKGKFFGHVRYLPKVKGVNIKVSKDGMYKAEKSKL